MNDVLKKFGVPKNCENTRGNLLEPLISYKFSLEPIGMDEKEKQILSQSALSYEILQDGDKFSIKLVFIVYDNTFEACSNFVSANASFNIKFYNNNNNNIVKYFIEPKTSYKLSMIGDYSNSNLQTITILCENISNPTRR